MESAPPDPQTGSETKPTERLKPPTMKSAVIGSLHRRDIYDDG